MRKPKNGKPQKFYTGKNKDFMGDPGRMERHAVDVFRDMSRGKYNFSNIAEFNNRDFVYAAIQAAAKNARKHHILKTALDYTYGTSSDPDVIALKNQEMATYNGWYYVYSGMINFMNSGDLGAIMGMAQYLLNNREIRL